MGWLAALFGTRRAKEGEPSAGLVPPNSNLRALADDLDATIRPHTLDNGRQDSEDDEEAFASAMVESVLGAGRLVIVDWDDEPEAIVEEFGRRLNGLGLGGQLEMLAAAAQEGRAALDNGKRGSGVLPTLAGIDRVLAPVGHRLLWIDLGGSSYDVAIVPEAVFARWRDVRVTRGTVTLECAQRNAVPRKRQLSPEPRPGDLPGGAA